MTTVPTAPANYNSSSIFEAWLALVAEKTHGLPPSLRWKNKDDQEVIEPLIYRVQISGNLVSMQGFILHDETTAAEQGPSCFTAEDAFVRVNDYWVGAPEHLFADYDPAKDTQQMTWATCYGRQAKRSLFYVYLEEPIFGFSFSKKHLGRLIVQTEMHDASSESLTPPLVPVPTQGGTISTTLGDHYDSPPVNASVSFLPTEPVSGASSNS